MLTKDNMTIKQIFHDLKNSLFVIESWIYFGEYNKAKAKILEISNSLDINQISVTGNKIIDAFIWLKIYVPCEKGINFKFEKSHFNISNMDDMDFCILIGNALDNSIEACEKLLADKQKNIRLTFNSNKDYNIISISNTIENPVKINQNSIKSTKNDNLGLHGLGLKQIKKIAKKYNGYVSMHQNKSRFFLDIMFKKT